MKELESKGNELKKSLKCEPMQEKINQLVGSGICTDFTGNLYNFYVIMFITILLVIASSMFACKSSNSEDINRLYSDSEKYPNVSNRRVSVSMHPFNITQV